MKPIESRITGGYWGRWLTVNASSALFHQWAQLEQTGCIDNFRILAEGKPVARRGWFFADSDAYKWLEAAYRSLALRPDAALDQLVTGFIDLIRAAQSPDGYLFTFNQIHFPDTRWVNLQIEHELYCHGHLIEACIAGYQEAGREDVLEIAQRAADRITVDFLGKGPRHTPGHEEIEISLLRLFEVTGVANYLTLARQFIQQRGKSKGFAVDLFKQNLSNQHRVKAAQAMAAKYSHEPESQLPESNRASKPPLATVRFFASALSGKLLQQHTPLIRQAVPVGHAVRWAYLQTAGAMLDRLSGEAVYRDVLSHSWQHMVTRRMYLTGGIGSLPQIEGFGRDYELDPGYAYAETCAALGSMFWNREMAKLTHAAQYCDLFEWQLYNAALVGMGLAGDTYLYNNPLETNGTVARRAWYEVPCCPSNLSRTWAVLGEDVLDYDADCLYVQQYLSSQHQVDCDGDELSLAIESGLPWSGTVGIRLRKTPEKPLMLKLRQPFWATGIQVCLNGELIQTVQQAPPETLLPQRAAWVTVTRAWHAGDRIDLAFDLPVQILRAHPKVRSVRGRGVVTRGPLVYCLESNDNSKVDLDKTQLVPSSLQEKATEMLGGISIIKGHARSGENLTFIPYHLWGNQGPSQMSVFVRLL